LRVTTERVGPAAGTHRARAAVAATISGLVVVGLAVVAGEGLATRAATVAKAAIFLFAAAGGIVLAVVAARRFSALLVTLFAVRPLLDGLKAGSVSSSLTPGSLAGVLLLAAGLTWLWAQRAAGTFVPLSRTSKAMLVFTLGCVVSIFASTSMSTSATAALKVASGVVMFLVLEQIAVRQPRQLRALLIAAAAITVMSAATAIIDSLLHLGFEYNGELRVNAFFVDSNTLAEFLTTTMLLFLGLLRVVRGDRLLRRLVVASVLLGLPALYTTFTRGAWLGFVLGLLVLATMTDKRLLTGLVLALVAVLVAVPSVSHRFADLAARRQAGLGDPNSFAFRERYWAHIAPLADSTPIVGIGLDMVQHTDPSGLLPHNTPLEVYIETGVFGLGGFLAIVICMALDLRRAARALQGGLPRGLAVGGIAAATAFGLQMLADNLLLQALQLWYLALATAPAIALGRRAELEAASRTEPVPPLSVPAGVTG
jgi:O-antigen ligase